MDQNTDPGTKMQKRQDGEINTREEEELQRITGIRFKSGKNI